MMKGFLVLESGEVFSGELVNWKRLTAVENQPLDKVPKKTIRGQEYLAFERAAEVVFNTSHFGYEEIATDPSYYSQMTVLTAPQQGNYGIDREVWESRQIWIQGFMALDIQNSTRDSSWLNQLIEHQVPILKGIDTRNLTLHLREKGTTWGAIVMASAKTEAINKAKNLMEEAKSIPKDWVFAVSRKESELRAGLNPKGPKMAVLDFGAKENIFRLLTEHSKEIKIFNSRASVKEIESYAPDGLMLTNGPGDPEDVQVAPETVQCFLGKIPIFGICMGHQILARALGAKTYKLTFGHRGSNHPIQDKLLKQIYVSSQNHGYVVDEKTLPKDVEVTHINLNDKSVAGIYSKERNFLGIQFHPESCPGPHDAQKLFGFFFEKMLGEINERI